MPETNFGLRLRECTYDDAEIVSDLEASLDPDVPGADPVRRLHLWRMSDQLENAMRRVAVEDGSAVAYAGASHELWEPDDKRFGVIRTRLRHDLWNDATYGELVKVAEQWLQSEGARTSVARVRGNFERELKALEGLGYREDRRMRESELDLVTNRNRILAARDESRQRTREQGVQLHVLSKDTDPEKYRKLFEMVIESEKDIPTTVPWRVLTFDEWRTFWFDNPAIREDWFWIAREGDAIVGTSVLEVPVVRGLPWTAYTGTSRAVRGRGIARALKYESIGQAIEAGFSRVRTSNDADNPAILHINEEMGYRQVVPVIELHRPLDS
jgi:RimJ/RimL family protein N-acetyltransferase